MQDNYFNNRTEKNIKKTREILDEFPAFAVEFFVGIQSKTSDLTRLNYAYDLRIFFDYLSKRRFKNQMQPYDITLKDLEKITAYDIELYLEYLSDYSFKNKRYKCKESAKQRKLATVRSFYKYYFNKDKLPANVAAKVDMPKIHDKPIIRLEVDEIVKLLNLVENSENPQNLSKRQIDFNKKTKVRDLAILTLFLGTGIRISELVGLNRTDFDFNSNAFIVTRKGGNHAQLYFSDEVRKALKEYINWLNDPVIIKKIKNKDAMFVSMQGQGMGARISVRSVENLVKKYSSIITPLKKITPHKLRTTYGTSLYRETQDIYVVADVLGHKDVNTTKKHYAAISDDIRRNASNAVKLRIDDEK